MGPHRHSFLVLRTVRSGTAALVILAALLVPARVSAQTCGAAGGAASAPSPASLADPPGRSCSQPAEPASTAAALPATGAGNPVDVVTGNKYLRVVDLALPRTDALDPAAAAPHDAAAGAGAAAYAFDPQPLTLMDGVVLALGWRREAPLALAFTRHYNGRHRFAGSLGPGWSHGFDTRIVVRAARAELQIVQGDGRRIVLRAAGRGRWRGAEPADGLVTREGGYIWRWPGGRRLTFDARGLLVRIAAEDGESLRLGRDARGRLVSVRDRAGRALHLRHRGDRLASVTATGLGTIRYGYDAHGRLVSVRHPDGRVIGYRYDDPRAWERLTAVIDADGRRSDYRYDDAGRVVFSRGIGEPAGIALRYTLPDSAGGVGETELSHAGGVAHYRWRYDVHAHRPMLIAATGVACPSCPPAGRHYRYDAARRLAGQGPYTLRRDALGRVVAFRAAGGATWRVRYGGDDPLAAPVEVDAPSVRPGRRHRIRLLRDAHGRLVERLEHGWSPLHDRPLVRRVRFTYEATGPASGRLARVVLGNATLRLHHDALGRLVALAAADDVVYAVARDGAGRVVGEYLPAGYTRAAAYDAIGRVVVRRLAGRTFHLRYAGAGGFLQAVTDAALSTDVGGAPEPDPREGSGVSPGVTRRVFAALPAPAPSRPRLARQPLGIAARDARAFVFVDLDGLATRQRFDDLGRLVHEVAREGGARRFEHDAADRLIAIRAADGRADTFHLDAAGRVVAREQSLGEERIETRIRYRGLQVVAVTHPAARWRAEWAPQGRLARLEQVAFGRRYVQSFRRDARGLLLAHGMPDGSRVEYRYDSRGRVVAIDWRPDPGSAARAIVRGVRYGVDRERAAWRPEALRLGNGLLVSRGLGPDGRLARILVARSGRRDERVLALGYRWDTAGRPAAIMRDGAEDHFAFDRLGRLLVRERGSEREYFAWSAGGRLRATRDAGAVDRRFVPGRAQPPGDAVNSGMAGLPDRIGAFRLRYGAQRRILAVVAPEGGVRARYRYGPMGERVEAAVVGAGAGAGPRRFLHHRRQLLAEVGAHGSVERLYLHWDGIPIATIDHARDASGRDAHAVHWLHTDHLGTPLAASDAAGRVAWRGRLAAFGRLLESSGGYRQPLRLPGQYADDETGLHDNFLRHYDPVRARFLEPDPLGLAAGPDRHAYADGDPLTRTDPLGLILFAFDGTGNDPSTATNVYAFANLYDSGDAFDEQAGFDGAANYVAGVGTGGGLVDNALTGGALALGLRARIDSQLARLDGYVRARFGNEATTREVGPEDPVEVTIDIVGFSRGAAAARDFANQVLRRRDAGYYRELVAGGCVRLNLRFMGLFDTVLSAHVGEFDLRIPEAVGYVASAIAANEHRASFPLESIHPSVDARDTAGNRVERSFVGAHADIGGGYACAPADSPGCDGGDLSDIALDWMIAQARAQGVGFDEIPESLRVVSRPIVHDERTQFPWFDPDPASDRDVRFNAVALTSPDSLRAVPSSASSPPPTAAEPTGGAATARDPPPVDAPLPSRVAIDDGVTADLGLGFVTPDATPLPGRIGTLDLEAYYTWLRSQPGYRLDG